MEKQSFDWGGIADPEILADTVLLQPRIAGFWCKFLRDGSSFSNPEIEPVGTIDKKDFSGAIIEVWDSELREGGTTVNVPMQMRLVQKPKSGNAPLQGTGESSNWIWTTVYYASYRTAYDLPTGDESQAMREKIKTAAEDGSRQLGNHMTEWLDGDYNFSLLTGMSANLSSLRNVEGYRAITALVPHSPANMHFAGVGLIRYGDNDRPGTAAYEDKVVAAGNATSTGNHGFSADSLSYIATWAPRHGIKRMNISGMELIPVVIKDTMHYALMRDDKNYKDAVNSGFMGKYTDNPMVTAAQVIYGGCIVYVNAQAFGITTDESGRVIRDSASSLGMPYYGPTGSWIGESGTYEHIDQNDLCVAIALSEGVLHKVYGRNRVQVTREKWDHGARHEMGMRYECAIRRADFRDAENRFGRGVDSFYANFSTAFFVFKQPYFVTM